jgi:hypothetical protein
MACATEIVSGYKPMKALREEARQYKKRLVLLATQLSAALSNSRIPRLVSKPKLIVSLTTFPARLPTVHLTIESILRQRVLPDSIELWLSREEISEVDLPELLRRQCKRGIGIRFVDENVRSYKKLVYSAVENPFATIVTADDDIIYPSYWLERLLRARDESTGSVVGYRARRVLYDADGNRAPYKEWPFDERRADPARPLFRLFPTGGSGILYPPESRSPELMETRKFMSLAPTADDVWFKAMTTLRMAPTRLVEPTSSHFPHVPGTQKKSLQAVNVHNGRNDHQIDKVFAEFGIDEILRREPD